MFAKLTLPCALLALTLSGPAAAQPPLLDYSVNQNFTYLDFNPPGGKTPAVRFACAKGLSKIEIAEYEGVAADVAVTLSSGGATLSLAGKKTKSARGVDFIKAEVMAEQKVMTGFRDRGELEITGPGFHQRIAVPDTGKGPIGLFFVSCEEGDNL